MKKLVSLLLAAVMVFSLAACGSGSNEAEVSLDSKKLAEELLEKIAFTDELSEVDAVMAYTALDESSVTESLVYTGTGGSAEEITVFKAADEGKVADLQSMVESRNKEYQEAYAGYGPDEVPKLKDAVLVTKGQYLVYCVSPDASAAKEIIDSYLK